MSNKKRVWSTNNSVFLRDEDDMGEEYIREFWVPSGGGNDSTLTGGYDSTLTGGDGSTLIAKYWDEKQSRYRFVIGEVCDGGLRAGIAYKCVDGRFVTA
jgi:hypothetical protein